MVSLKEETEHAVLGIIFAPLTSAGHLRRRSLRAVTSFRRIGKPPRLLYAILAELLIIGEVTGEKSPADSFEINERDQQVAH